MINDAGKHGVKSRRANSTTDAIRATLLLPRMRCFAEEDFAHVSNFVYAMVRLRTERRCSGDRAHDGAAAVKAFRP
jgi:hypothetical protein